MKLQAITVCVHGADLLASALSNRHHFDRWLIVTVSRDAGTIALCTDRGLECVTTGILRPDGADLYDDDKLARVHDEALARLDPDGWVVLLSEQVVLPRTFRAQVQGSRLDTDREYRLAGVRHCASRGTFERLAPLEPWRALPSTAPDEDTPFRMFARSANPTPARLDELAITALTVSGAGTQPAAASDPRRSLMTWFGARLRGKRVLVAGCHPGLDVETLATCFDAVYLQDLVGLRAEAPAPAAPGYDGLHAVWAAALLRLAPSIGARVRELAPGDDAGVPSSSIDVLYLPGEVLPETAVRCLPFWRRVLHPDAIVCGDLYGMADWPEATSTIVQLFGRPQIDPTGFWSTSLAGAPFRRTVAAANGADALELSAGAAPDEDVLLSLHSLRKAWPGPVRINAQRPDPALALLCAVLGGAWTAGDDSAERAPRLAVAAGTLAFGPIGHMQAAAETDAERYAPPTLLQRVGLARRSSLVRYNGNGVRWTETARDARRILTADLYRTLMPSIPTPPDSTVATIIDPETLAAFKAQWPRWSFETAPIIILHTGIDPAELGWALAFRKAQCLEIAPETAASPTRTLRRIVSRARTRRLILLPAGARPLPGATLFTDQDQSSAPITFHSSTELQPVGGVASLPGRREPLAALMDLTLARDVCRAPIVKHKGTLAALLYRAIHASRAHWSVCNLGREGWQLELGPAPKRAQ
jgi:hypothetical protein